MIHFILKLKEQEVKTTSTYFASSEVSVAYFEFFSKPS
jgi:hypothetical protein